MSSTTIAHKGLEACKNREWANAVSLLDKALQDSNSPSWLLARATAHTQLKNYDAAFHDVELAYHSAAERGSGTSRKQMIEAQYRRAVIYYKLGRYADSDCCCKWSMLLAEGRPANEKDGVEQKVDGTGNYNVTYEEGIADTAGQPGSTGPAAMAGASEAKKTGFETDWNRAYAWRSQVLAALKSLPEDSPARKVNVSKIPARPQKKVEKKPEPEVVEEDEPEKPVVKAAPAPGSVPDEKLKLRIDFYQTNQTVTVTLFSKDVKKDGLQVEFGNKQVRISPIPRETAPYVKPGDREATSTLLLADSIIPSSSRWSATPRKIELVLQKATPGVKWGTWGEEKIGSVDFEAAASELPAAPVSQPETEASAPSATSKKENAPQEAAGPAYPTSSKSGPKNWDKLDEAEDDEDKQDVNWFFKKLYKDASPEQQRAMMKSFVESNGTALSTDWNDVKARKVETVPPDGVEAKKWER